MGLIGRGWKLCEGWSRPVLIGRGLAHSTFVARIHCVTLSTQPASPVGGGVFAPPCGGSWIVLSVVVAEGERPVPSRTRKLSPPAPMVLHSPGCGRVGRRRHQTSRKGPGTSVPGPFSRSREPSTAMGAGTWGRGGPPQRRGRPPLTGSIPEAHPGWGADRRGGLTVSTSFVRAGPAWARWWVAC